MQSTSTFSEFVSLRGPRETLWSSDLSRSPHSGFWSVGSKFLNLALVVQLSLKVELVSNMVSNIYSIGKGTEKECFLLKLNCYLQITEKLAN